MSKEQQLQFDISRCSLCPLGAHGLFFSPSLTSKTDVVVVMESPSLGVCASQNPWQTPGASFLSQAISHASGPDLSRFHLTFISKCHGRVDGLVPPQQKKREWAQVCASQYFQRELQEIRPRQLLIFGELAAQVCFPDAHSAWEDLQGQTLTLEPMGLSASIFDQLTKLQKVGLDSMDGEAFLLKLHELLGGTYSAPDARKASNLFDFF